MDRWIQNEKKVIVEAVQLRPDTVEEIKLWTGGMLTHERGPLGDLHPALNISTPQGLKRLSEGMYIVRFQGQFYLAKQGQFEGQYTKMTTMTQPSIVVSPRDKKKLPKFQREPWFDEEKDVPEKPDNPPFPRQRNSW